MFTFKEFITEGRDAPLYHGTTLDTAMQILKHDMIQGRTNHENRILGINKPGSTGGVSLSRSFKISEWFGEVIFELDQRKLTHNYRINPVQFFSSQGPMLSARTKKLGGNKVLSGRHTEAEEFVIGSIKNVSKYITKIHIPEKVYRTSEEVFKRDKRFVPYRPKV